MLRIRFHSTVCTRKTRILNVVYNASNNELVRTNTLVKGCIVQIDATPFRQWYEKHYGFTMEKKKKEVGCGGGQPITKDDKLRIMRNMLCV